MQQIEIDFEVFKALTARRRSENHTYNHVIRELLGMDSGLSIDQAKELSKDANTVVASSGLVAPAAPTKGFALRGLILPNGTLLKARYKGCAYHAQIVDGKWVNDDGRSYSSPSSAASAITGTNVNGWRFWQAKRPSDTEWRNLDMLPKAWP